MSTWVSPRGEPSSSVMPEADPEVLKALVDNHRQFLAFLQGRTASLAEAEDVLQAAFLRAVEKGGDLRSGESAVAWFYRLLRNALVDRHRQHDARERALERRALEDRALTDGANDDPALRAEACRCVAALVPALKPEYAELLTRVEIDEQPVNQAARALGVTPGNAAVRLHRARRALLREVQRSCGTCATHGCLDCSCGGPPGSTPGT